MRERLHNVRAYPAMTVQTDFRLRRMQTDRIGRRMHAVAIRASNFVALMHAAMPCQRHIVCMAGRADRVLVGNGCGRFGSERDHRCAPTADAATLRMFATGAVAILTLQLRHRRFRVYPLPMRGPEKNEHVFVVVTAQTGIGPFGAVAFWSASGSRIVNGPKRCKKE